MEWVSFLRSFLHLLRQRLRSLYPTSDDEEEIPLTLESQEVGLGW